MSTNTSISGSNIEAGFPKPTLHDGWEPQFFCHFITLGRGPAQEKNGYLVKISVRIIDDKTIGICSESAYLRRRPLVGTLGRIPIAIHMLSIGYQVFCRQLEICCFFPKLTRGNSSF